WDNNIDSIAKKAQQRLYFLCQLREAISGVRGKTSFLL
ncbi:hypothetical protein C0J45_2233, partial [Silurus meridionalis]